MVAMLLASIAMISSRQAGFQVSLPHPSFDATKETVTVLDPVRTTADWDEAIVSWNVAGSARAFVKVEAQAKFEDRETAWMTLAEWTGDLHAGPRRSVKDQKDPDGEVQTDTFHLNRPCRELHLRVTTRQIAPGDLPKIKLLMVSLSDIAAKDAATEPSQKAWGKTLAVPERSQMPYEKGALCYDPAKVSPTFETWFKNVKTDQYCSPSASSMVLAYWARVLKRNDLDAGVPDVVAGVFDEIYPGTGNWVFNTAYMGSFDGLEAYVARWPSVENLQEAIERGEPVICSVSYNLLQGNGKKPGGDGHLVVLIGFTETGDPVFNDPGRSEVRQVYRLDDFRKAWGYSHRTVYVVRPSRD